MFIHDVKTDAAGQPEQAKSCTMVLGNEEHRHWEKTDLFAPVITECGVRSLCCLRPLQRPQDSSMRCQECLLPSQTSRGSSVCRHASTRLSVLCAQHLLETKEDPPWTSEISPPLVPNFQRNAGRTWIEEMSTGSMSIHRKVPTGGSICFGMCVDDCACFGTDDAAEAWFEAALGSKLKIDFVGDLSCCLGVHCDCGLTPDGRLTVHMSQEGHIHKMLAKHDMLSPNNHCPVNPFKVDVQSTRCPQMESRQTRNHRWCPSSPLWAVSPG